MHRRLDYWSHLFPRNLWKSFRQTTAFPATWRLLGIELPLALSNLQLLEVTEQLFYYTLAVRITNGVTNALREDCECVLNLDGDCASCQESVAIRVEGKDPRESSVAPRVIEAIGRDNFPPYTAYLRDLDHLVFLHSQLSNALTRRHLLVKVEHYIPNESGIDGVHEKLVTKVKDIATSLWSPDDDALSPPAWTMEGVFA